MTFKCTGEFGERWVQGFKFQSPDLGKGSDNFCIIQKETHTKTTPFTKLSPVVAGLKILQTKPKSELVVGWT